MASSESTPFERVFPRREWLAGPARAAVLWSFLGSVLLCLLLVDLYLIADLFETGGRLKLTAEESQALSRLIAEPSAHTGGEDAPPGIAGPRQYEDSGLLPSVWRSRHHLWGPQLAALYRAVPLLGQNSTSLMLLIAVAVMLGLLRGLLLARARWLSMRTGLDVVTRLRRTLHRQTLRLGPGDLENSENETALSLFTADMDRLRDGVTLWVQRLGRYPLELVLLLTLAILMNWRVSLELLIPLAACWYLVERERYHSAIVRQLAEARGAAGLRLLSESLHKTRIVRGYGMETFEHEQFQKHLERFRENVCTVKQQEHWSRWARRVLITICGAIVLFLVGSKVLQSPHELSLAAALAILATFGCMQRPGEGLWRLGVDRENASLSADRILRYLNQIPEVGQAVGAKFLQPLSKSLQFEAVSYVLANRGTLLDGFSLKISAGESVALVSLDPLETRAAAYLLPRFIEPQKGRVLFDGEDIAWVTLESLRAETVYVGGTDPFFTGTVLENISCGNSEYSLSDVTEAAKTAHAHQFILRLPQGYATVIGEHGEQLDAGQGFRLGLARAVLRNPALMIIEEPTEPLDDDTKSLLDDAYNRILHDRTVVFLPARLSTVRRVDCVAVVHQGKLEAIGKHFHVVKTSPLYRHWEYVRFNEFRDELELRE